jgi:hypothetical protein
MKSYKQALSWILTPLSQAPSYLTNVVLLAMPDVHVPAYGSAAGIANSFSVKTSIVCVCTHSWDKGIEKRQCQFIPNHMNCMVYVVMVGGLLHLVKGGLWSNMQRADERIHHPRWLQHRCTMQSMNVAWSEGNDIRVSMWWHAMLVVVHVVTLAVLALQFSSVATNRATITVSPRPKCHVLWVGNMQKLHNQSYSCIVNK